VIDLDLITQRYSHYSETDKLNKNTAVYHVRILVEEVNRLKAELDKLKQQC
jgi:uncharacterized small protein (DUF1192 family)